MLAQNAPMTRERFWSKVDLSSGCWLYPGAVVGDGYRRVGVNGKRWLAHRYAWSISKGNIPEGMQVLHKCDVPNCVKPWHLFLGTHQDNMNDKVAKNRQFRGKGEANSMTKLTIEQVTEIRNRRLNGESIGAIAKNFPVNHQTISAICLNKKWKHIN